MITIFIDTKNALICDFINIECFLSAIREDIIPKTSSTAPEKPLKVNTEKYKANGKLH